MFTSPSPSVRLVKSLDRGRRVCVRLEKEIHKFDTGSSLHLKVEIKRNRREYEW